MIREDMAFEAGEGFEGREGALAALRGALRESAPRGRLVVVRGAAGSGRSTVLRTAARRWIAEGVRAAQVRPVTGTLIDGFDAVLHTLRAHFDRFADPGLIDRISKLSRLRVRAAEDPAEGPAVVAELTEVFDRLGRLGRLGPTALLFDDVDRIVDPALLLITARRPGCLVVAAVRDPATPAGAELTALADEVVGLGPLDEQQIAAAVGGSVHPDLLRSLRTALGPLYGNPGTVLGTLERLHRDRRLTTSSGRTRLRDPGSPVPLPEDHDLLHRTRDLGGVAPRLLAAVAAVVALDMDDLPAVADALGTDLATCGRTLDRLVDAGLLVADADGRLSCLCTALADSAAAAHPGAVRGIRALGAAAPVAPLRPVVAAPPPKSGARPWTPAEHRIVDLIGGGRTNRQIATALGVSEKTVEKHLTRLFTKSGCRSRVELVTTRLRGAAPEEKLGRAS
ncbi:LuxR family transcriptional regulator [Saccharopolyspora sp. NFXS83]|uniref:helix-turn-helix transcriptional regulator n=1 Tax=Saccharopolyspora sp. NFXS83 TaxID=2993560 RepID=UPI00224B84CF|nr:LuxR family transcriptional regulator [Saccharopolyspora sp. NFXS83]MCX2730116.1 LuxR family transcriptional regulator [Saccharopolyspora sp. NFXS83]